jgi:anti-sigma B factor antagonist
VSYNTISVENIRDITIIKVLERRVFLKISDQFRDEVVRIIDGGATRVIIDLSTVHVMNSSGLGVLILARDMLQKKGGKIILCGLLKVMEEIFSRMHLDNFFEICKNVTEAMEAMGVGQK